VAQARLALLGGLALVLGTPSLASHAATRPLCFGSPATQRWSPLARTHSQKRLSRSPPADAPSRIVLTDGHVELGHIPKEA